MRTVDLYHGENKVRGAKLRRSGSEQTVEERGIRGEEDAEDEDQREDGWNRR